MDSVVLAKLIAEERYLTKLFYQNLPFCYNKLSKLIGISSENPYGAKRTRTADPLHAMQVLYQLSYGPKSPNVSVTNLS